LWSDHKRAPPPGRLWKRQLRMIQPIKGKDLEWR
jgi:hypothetical protein